MVIFRLGDHVVKDDSCRACRSRMAYEVRRECVVSGYLESDAIVCGSKQLRYFFNNLLYAGIFVHDGKTVSNRLGAGCSLCEPYVTLGMNFTRCTVSPSASICSRCASLLVVTVLDDRVAVLYALCDSRAFLK
jgi:hypothetical protein